MASSDVKAISLFVQHTCGMAYNSLYFVPLPPLESAAAAAAVGNNEDEDNSGVNIKFELNGIKPVCHFAKDTNPLLEDAVMAAVGTQIYFLGGLCRRGTKPDVVTRAVYALDTDKPEEGLRPVAPMNAPKERPCVFVSDGMVYALGWTCSGPELVPGGTGLFERYDPISDKWEVLPDPPLTLIMMLGTVVGRDVYFGCWGRRSCGIYNLDSKQWRIMSPSLACPFLRRFTFPFGSVYVDGFLYYLRGGNSRDPVALSDHEDYGGPQPLQLVARRFRPNHDSAPGPAQVIAKAHDLDGAFFFTAEGFYPWRRLFHLGGRFFCYVVSCELDDEYYIRDHMTRGIGINVFEVVQQPEFKFRSVASVCYTAPTLQTDVGYHLSFSALTTLPNCLTKIISKGEQCEAAAKAKMYSETKSVDHHHEDRHREVIPDMAAQKGDDVEMILKAQQAQISRLMAELAVKEELLNKYLHVA